MNGISVLKTPHRAPLLLLPSEGPVERRLWTRHSPRDTASARALALDFPASTAARSTVLPGYDIFVAAARTDEDGKSEARPKTLHF